jgi:AraC-like DNA-binding protein
MIFRSHVPAQPVAAFVDYLWALRDAPSHAKEWIVPTGTLEIVINLEEDELRIYDAADPTRCRRWSGAVVSGAYRGPFVVDTRDHASVMGVHFAPGGASSVLGLPAGELADAHVDLATLWGARATELRERLCSEPDAARRFQILERALHASLDAGATRQPSLRESMDALGEGASVGQLAARLGLTHKRFIDVFTADVGMTPKRFARVRRFQRALTEAGLRPAVWSHVALACGYFDQSHMSRDFVELAGAPPAALLRATSAEVKAHHVVLPSG